MSFFFFSSRRRHTRCSRDWSSDVCSSDLTDGIVRGDRPSVDALGRITAVLRLHAVDVALVRTRNGFERRRLFQPREPIHLLVPVAESASELLCHGDLALVLKCENPRCILYFYDTTKNHARRWCSMTVCGNRMKVPAHYRRRRRTREHTLGGTGHRETSGLSRRRRSGSPP